jgi:hypothetical protein
MKKLTLTLLIVCGILLASVGFASAQDCTPWGCGCPGPEEFWEGACQIMPVEPAPLPHLFIPWIEKGSENVDCSGGCEF